MHLATSRFSRIVLAAVSTSALLLSGCAMGTLTLSGPDPSPVQVHVTLSGNVHGGQQPVSGATIQLSAAGNTGYGSARTTLINGGTVGSVTVTANGSGYTSTPTVAFSSAPNGGTTATGTAVTSGSVTSVTVTYSGSGYSSAPTVTFYGGSGSGAAAVANVSGGKLVSITVTNGGGGYAYAPSIALGGGGALQPGNATASLTSFVTGVTLTNAGAGYTSSPTVSFSGGGGSGAAATAVAVPTGGVISDANGNFSITGDFTCPSSTAQVAITAKGGNPGLTSGTNNTAIKLVAPLGQCGNLSNSTYIFLNEVTTAASAFAGAQYFTTTYGATSNDSFGAPNTTQAQLGLANAYSTVTNLVNTTTGNAIVSNTITNSVGSVTVTPESAKLNTIADILAACVNTTGPTSTACSTLFSSVAPAGATAPVNTLEAAVYMALNPTSTNANPSATNIAALYGLATASPPYIGLSTAPTDWTLGINYYSNSTATYGTATPYLLNYPTYLAVDASGDIWVVNDVSTSATATSNSLTELSPTGTPLLQTLTGSTLIGPAGITIDPSGNVFIPNYGSSSALQTSVVEYTAGGATNTFTTNKGPQRIASDGRGDIFVLEPSYKGLGDLEVIPTGSTSGTAATTIASGLTTDFSNLAIDSNYTVWVTGGGTGAQGGTAGYPYVYQFLLNNSTSTYPSTPSATVNVGGVASPEQAIAIDNSNNVWVQNYGAETVAEFAGTTTVSGSSSAPYGTYTNLSKPEFQIFDGAGNLWVTDAATPTASPAGSVYEILASGASTASPTTGFAHTYSEPFGIAIDPSGNVWVAAYNASASSTVQSFITEIVGAAVPVVTPLAAGLPYSPGGTSLLGTRP